MKKKDIEERIKILEHAVFCHCRKPYTESFGTTKCFLCGKLLKDAVYIEKIN